MIIAVTDSFGTWYGTVIRETETQLLIRTETGAHHSFRKSTIKSKRIMFVG